jgi:hypothetical protein
MEFNKRAKEARKLGFNKILGTDRFQSLNEVLNFVGK